MGQHKMLYLLIYAPGVSILQSFCHIYFYLIGTPYTWDVHSYEFVPKRTDEEVIQTHFKVFYENLVVNRLLSFFRVLCGSIPNNVFCKLSLCVNAATNQLLVFTSPATINRQ